MSYAIQLHDGDLPIPYWSESRKIHPAGNWGEVSDALKFDTQEAAQEYVNTRLSTQAELCKVVPVQ